ANLIFQNLQIILGENFLEDWTNDIDGIIDYLEKLREKIKILEDEQKEKTFIDLLSKISINVEYLYKKENQKKLEEDLQNIEEKIQNYNNLKDNIANIYERKKEIIKEIKKIEKILSQESEIKKE